MFGKNLNFKLKSIAVKFISKNIVFSGAVHSTLDLVSKCNSIIFTIPDEKTVYFFVCCLSFLTEFHQFHIFSTAR